MRLPRWLVVSLLSASVFVVLGAGAWWWVTWPERTINRFLNAAKSGDIDAWRSLQGDEVLLTLDQNYSPQDFTVAISWRSRRSLIDLVRCRQDFGLVAWNYRFGVERGHVVSLLAPGDWEPHIERPLIRPTAPTPNLSESVVETLE